MPHWIEEALGAKRIFRRARTDDRTRALGIVLYHLGLSLRDTSLVLAEGFVARSHEAVRRWYGRARWLFLVGGRARRAIAVDETEVRIQGRWMYLWAAIDVDTWEVLVTCASQSRSGLEALSFLRVVLEVCDGKPLVYVDRAGWYRFALDRLGVPWEHRTFGPRNPIEQWFGILKQRIKRFYRRWPHNADLERSNGWVRAFTACYHIKRAGRPLC